VKPDRAESLIWQQAVIPIERAMSKSCVILASAGFIPAHGQPPPDVVVHKRYAVDAFERLRTVLAQPE